MSIHWPEEGFSRESVFDLHKFILYVEYTIEIDSMTGLPRDQEPLHMQGPTEPGRITIQ